MAVTETIQELLQGIDESQYGRDMRQFIHKGIQKCYEEGSAGETDLTARTNIDMLADNFGNVESTSTASQDYSVGDTLVYNYTLYKVISDIQTGDTITPGTNVSVTSVDAGSDVLPSSVKNTLTLDQSCSLTPYPECYYYKKGSTVCLHLSFLDVAFGTLYNIATLPEGYRPTAGMGFAGSGGYKEVSIWTIDVDGKITLFVPQTNSSVSSSELAGAATILDARFDIIEDS